MLLEIAFKNSYLFLSLKLKESILCRKMTFICETPCTLDIATDYRCFYLRTVVIGSSVDKHHVALGFHTGSLNSTKTFKTGFISLK